MSHATAKDLIWSFGRETEIDYVNSRTSNELYRKLLYAVVDAVIEIRETGVVTPTHLEAFRTGVECSNEVVLGPAGKRLVECSYLSPLASSALLALATSPKWRVRFNVMCLLEDRPPEALAMQLLQIGLQDNSSKAACRAVQACDEVRYPSALPLLESRLGVEDRPEVIDTIRWTLGLMRTTPIIRGKSEERHYDGAVFVRGALKKVQSNA